MRWMVRGAQAMLDLRSTPWLSSRGFSGSAETVEDCLNLFLRENIWQTFLEMAPDRNATTSILGAAGIRPLKTGQGIFRDHANTSTLAPEGVTLTLLDTGTTYDDAFDDDAGEYHYPATRRGGSRDDNEINATKNAYRFGLPVFVILRGASAATREVRRGWIETWDDDRRVFLVSFLEPREQGAATQPVLEPFALASGPRTRRDSTVAQRPSICSSTDSSTW
jgi:hypothetical protein